ncbi:MAG: Fic family protein [Verrucomicrobiota bacterium]
MQFDAELDALREKASLALGRLDGLAAVLPDASMFLYTYIRKEAVLSSQIEGTQSSLSDLLLFENEATPGVPLNDVQEVSNYVAAMNYGLKRLPELPLSLRLLKEIHGELLAKGRGSSKEPGQFRRSQNWIGGNRPGNATFVPPPPDQLNECLGALEKFLHNQPVATPALIKAGLAHVQFESIHPFLDGNGRLGRLLITFILCAEGVLRDSLLYLSLYFKQHRQEYYDLLQQVRVKGDWEAWLKFFLKGVYETAEQSAKTAHSLMRLAAKDETKIQGIGRAAGSALRVHRYLQRQPITSIAKAADQLRLSVPAAATALRNLEKIGIVREVTGGSYGRLYAYQSYLKLLEDKEPEK